MAGSKFMRLLAPALLAAGLHAQVAPTSYTLGFEDQLFVRVLDLDEFSDKDNKPVRIDMRGNVVLPLVGRVHASGLTVEQFEAELVTRFKKVLQSPEVTVSVVEYRPQPISVLGAVKTPGVHQIYGRKTLYEVLSLAGGLNPDAGNIINITRRKSAGPLPLPNAVSDATGEYNIGSLNVKSVMEAKIPQDNIEVLPQDVISIPKASLVYVIGAVKKPGGFVLSEKEKLSVLEALSLSEGLDHTASAKSAKILRPVSGSDNRQEIPVNVSEILNGRSGDVSLLAEDILFIPTNVPKSAALRGLEAAIQVGTGLAIYRR